MKYELTNEARDVGRHTVYRIRATEDIPVASDHVIKAGTLGGFVESESNLSQQGLCWIYDEAVVYGGAIVSGKANVRDYAQVSGNARICKNAHVYGQAVIAGNVTVRGHAWIDGNAFITAADDDQLVIEGNCYISGDARIDGTMTLGGNVMIGNGAMIKSAKDVFQVSLNAKDEIINATFYRIRKGVGCTEDHIEHESVEAFRDVFLRKGSKERVALAELAERMFNLQPAVEERKLEQTIRNILYDGPNDETAFGEPIWWIGLESGRSVEITLESYDIPKHRGYNSIRLHCTNEEFENDTYRGTGGVIDQLFSEDIGARSKKALYDETAALAASLIMGYKEKIVQNDEELDAITEAALNARACNKKIDELEESDAITDAVNGARICVEKLHMHPGEIAYGCPVWKFRLESGRTLEVTLEKKGYYAVRLKEADQTEKYLCIEQKFTKEGSKDLFGEVAELIASMLLEFNERIIEQRDAEIPAKDDHERLRVWYLWNKNRVVFAVAYGKTLEDAIKRTCTRLDQNGDETDPSEWDGEEFAPGTYGGVIILD